MTVQLQIPLDIPDIRLLTTSRTEQGELLLEVESCLDSTPCRRCGRELRGFHGFDRAIRLRHLPILEQVVWIEIRPKRYQCRTCDGRPTTTQRLSWYEENSPHTKVFDRWLLKRLMGSTVADVSRYCEVGYAAVEGALSRGISPHVDWEQFEHLPTLGMDEIALKKGHRDYVAIISCRDEAGHVSVLAVLPDRLKASVVAFLQTIPERLKPTIERVCTDMYEGYINAVREVLPDAEIVIDRFHVAKLYHAGVDQLRQHEMRRLKRELPTSDYQALKGVMWVYRRHEWTLNDEQRQQLALLFQHAPNLQQAYLLRHQLTLIFEAHSTKTNALAHFEAWQQTVINSGLHCFDAFLTTLNNWREEIANYFNGRHSSGFVEGLNNKLKVIKRRCYGLFKPSHLFQRIQLDLDNLQWFSQIS